MKDPIVIEATFYAHELPKNGQETITFAVDEYSRTAITRLTKLKGLIYVYVLPEAEYDEMISRVEQ